MSSMLTQEEQAVLDHLVAAWNAFLALEELHHCDRQEFMAVLHAAQRVVMARPVLRELVARKEVTRDEEVAG